ncbi:Clp protease N-terminal domain-containing protein [Pseudarthrobacter phenanthrenivorans]|uniref:Clp R domain-containing protein n=1 Tax=Pseudarthrobacter phenanthrenivorans TaxID=361575 RepID=A0A0B4D5P3_PSEPS|nr:Clp protease N-terminal domain-containing protein [Pseudarthrobacter phenanthrenivorans]KIC68679.1 hypothetical protein RM50_04220 [Pseudarthrobacter phenanthrenivorans]
MIPPLGEAVSASLILARAEAGRHGHPSAATEHLLLALATIAGPELSDILGALGTSCEALRAAVRTVITPGKPSREPVQRLTPRTKVALDLAVSFADRRRAHRIGAEHLLYGLTAEREGLAAQVLLSLGITAATVDRLLPALEPAA